MRGKLVVGNWKLNGGLAANARCWRRLRRGLDARAGRRERIAVCVPFPYLAQAQAALQATPVAWGAQDVSEHASGRVSPAKCRRGCSRSSVAGTRWPGIRSGGSCTAKRDAMVAAKARRRWRRASRRSCASARRSPSASGGDMQAVVLRQLDAVSTALGDAIGADRGGVRAGVGDRHRAHGDAASRRRKCMRCCAGGLREAGGGGRAAAVRRQRQGGQRAALFAMRDIDGGLVGGASLDANEFLAIARA